MEQNLDITNKFPQSLGTSLNRGSTVKVSDNDWCLRLGVTVEPRFNVISRVCSIHFTVTRLENNYRSLCRGRRYVEFR